MALTLSFSTSKCFCWWFREIFQLLAGKMYLTDQWPAVWISIFYSQLQQSQLRILLACSSPAPPAQPHRRHQEPQPGSGPQPLIANLRGADVRRNLHLVLWIICLIIDLYFSARTWSSGQNWQKVDCSVTRAREKMGLIRGHRSDLEFVRVILNINLDQPEEFGITWKYEKRIDQSPQHIFYCVHVKLKSQK